MAAPTNTTSGTAIDLGTTFPVDYVQDVYFEGTTYSVWVSFVAPPGAKVMGTLPIGSGSYAPQAHIFHSADLVNKIADPVFNGASQFVVTPGETYFIRIVAFADSDPSVVHLSVVVHEETEIPNGSFLITDDGDSDDGYPAVVLSSVTDFLVHAFVPQLPSGEQGDCSDEGNLLLEDSTGQSMVLFDRTFAALSTIPGFVEPRIRINRRTNAFWVSENQSLVTFVHKVHKISATGQFGPREWTIDTTNTIQAQSANLDETRFYFGLFNNNEPIRVWDLESDSALSDFAPGVPNYTPIDILVLFDETVVVSYWSSFPDDIVVRRYSPNGVLLNTYPIGQQHDIGPPFPRMCSSLDNLTSFWIWFHPEVNGHPQSRMLQIRASDGELMRTVNHAAFQTGGALGAPGADAYRFGTPISCPLIVLRRPTPILDESEPCCPESQIEGGGGCDCPPGGGGGSGSIPTGSPSSDPTPSSTGPVPPVDAPPGPLTPLDDPYWDALCEGGGLVPTAANPTDSEIWVS